MHKLINSLQQSVFIPLRIRGILLAIFGYDIHSSSRIAEDVYIGSKKLTIGPNTFVNIKCFLDGCARITLEEGVHLGPFVKILTGTHSYDIGSVFRRGGASVNIHLPVVVERGSWIGMGAIIMPGVVIGEGCIIGAGSIVLKSTAPNGVYVGNPAKRIRDLATT